MRRLKPGNVSIAMNIFDRIKESVRVEESEETAERFKNVESFFGKGVGGGGVSWGLLLLCAFAVYGVINLVMVILELF